MTPILIVIQPFNPFTAARETVRIASAGSSAAFGLEGQRWRPAIVQRPVLSIELMSPDLDGRVQAGRCRFSFDLGVFGDKRMGRWKWKGATISVYSAPDLRLRATADFTGIISTPSLDRDTMILSVDAVVDIDFLNRPLLTGEFDGSGSLGGEAEMRGTLKPAGFGLCENVPPVFFDKTNWIGMVDGYANTQAITRLMEGLNDFGASVGNYASYADLKAAIEAKNIPPGRWGTCLAQGLIGLGAPPKGPITVNAQFGYNRLGAWAQRILGTHAGVPAGRVDAAAFNALDATVNRATHYWTSEQRDVRELLETMAASANATPLVTGQGMVTITRAVATAAVATLDRSGSRIPRVTDWQSAAPQTPVWRMTARVARPASTVDLKDVNYVDDIIDRGAYAATTVYRAGNVVWLPNKSSWLYTNPVAAAGNAPPAYVAVGQGDAYWTNQTPPALASALTYADGTSIESLKPAQAAADKTSGNVAAGISGQAATATSSDFSVVTGTTKPENNATSGAIVGTNLKSTGGTIYTQQAIVTAEGVASAIAGQGAFATVSQVSYGSSFLTGFGYLATQPYARFGNGTILDSNLNSVRDIDAITAQGIASAIAGQGAFATVSQVGYGSNFLTGFKALAARDYSQLGDGSVRTSGLGILYDADAITSQGVASAIAGQGALATKGSVAWGSQFVTGFGYMASQPYARLGNGTLLDSGLNQVGDTDALTRLGTAAAIAGQGTLATKNAVDPFTQISNFQAISAIQWDDFGANMTGAKVLGNTARYDGGAVFAGQRTRTKFANGARISAKSTVGVANSTFGLYSEAEITATNADPANAEAGTKFIVLQSGYYGASVDGTFLGYFAYPGGPQGTDALDLFVFNGRAYWYVNGVEAYSYPCAPNKVYSGAVIFANAPVGTVLQGLFLESYVDPVQAGGAVLKTSGMQTNGRVIDGRTLNSNSNFGLRSLSAPPGMSSTAQTSSATVNFDANGVFYTDWGATIALPSASFAGLANSTRYYFWRNMPTPDGAGSSYGYSTALTDALGTGKVYLGYYDTPSASGSGGTGGSGGNYGGRDCVAIEAFVNADGAERPAETVRADAMIEALSIDGAGGALARVTGCSFAWNECVLLTTISGIRLTLALNTPMTTPDGWIIAANVEGREVPVRDADGFRWERVARVAYAGRRKVAHILCNGATYAAGDERGRFIYSHNPVSPISKP